MFKTNQVPLKNQDISVMINRSSVKVDSVTLLTHYVCTTLYQSRLVVAPETTLYTRVHNIGIKVA